MSRKEQKSLSDSRGNTLGITILKGMMYFPGLHFTCSFIWVISFFYALFDRRGRQAASYYLRHRFPEDGKLKRFYHTWKLFTSQGQSLLQAFALKIGKCQFELSHFERYKSVIANESQGAIFLCSHFGSWQGMMGMIDHFDRKIYILARPDRNNNVNKNMAATEFEDKIGWISTESDMGGLLEAYEVLCSGGVLCIMGDRCMENDAVEVDFLGGKAAFPLAAFQLAAQAQVPVFPVFAFRRSSCKKISLDIMEPIFPGEGIRRRNRVNELNIYTAILEDMAEKYPFECYIFENIWSVNEKN